MVKAIIAIHAEIASLSLAPHQVILAFAGTDDEVEYLWTLPASL